MSPASEQVVVVNGGANGIGMAISEAFAATGAVVALLDIDAPAATRAVDQITAAGGRAQAWTCDISSEQQVEVAFAEIETKLGHVGVLVNNAGINPRALPLEVDIETWQRAARGEPHRLLSLRPCGRARHGRPGLRLDRQRLLDPPARRRWVAATSPTR